MKDNEAKQGHFFLWIVMLFTLLVAQTLCAADEEGCLICHKYPGLGRIDQETGSLRLFYVNDDTYKTSVHGKVLCRNCHLNLDVIPHTDARKVDCATKCHLKEPSTDREFSHGSHYTEINNSIHGKFTNDGKPKRFSEDMPGCTDCHLNSIYRPVTSMTSQEAGVSADALRRCLGCHEDKDWTNRFYRHFSHRLHSSKTSKETVLLCLQCHENGKMMSRHGLIATANYKDTYHWKGVLFGDANAPDCISCHAPVGYPVHSMNTMLEPSSAVHKNNLRQTCSNTSGVQQCHPNATAKFAEGEIHQAGLGLEDTVAAFIKDETALSDIDVLRKERRFRNLFANVDLDPGTFDEDEAFHRKVYGLVRYIYTLLITVVIGGMLLHQIMDFYRTVKNLKKHGEEK